jgi:hypothetical protein
LGHGHLSIFVIYVYKSNIILSFSIMALKVVSLRLEESDLGQIDHLAELMAVDRTTIIRRLVSVGVEGLVKYENSAVSADWPREGRMRLNVLPVD